MSRKILAMLGVSLVVAVPLLGAYEALHYLEKRINQSGWNYVDHLVPALCGSWDYSLFLKEASPEFRAKLADTDERDRVKKFSGFLGPMTEHRVSEGRIYFPWISSEQRGIVGRYEVTVKSQKGYAVFRIGIILRNGRWNLLSFDEW